MFMTDTALDQINEFSWVILTQPVEQEGVTFPVGTSGVVMHVYSDGLAYEVEIDTLHLHACITVEKDALALLGPV